MVVKGGMRSSTLRVECSLAVGVSRHEATFYRGSKTILPSNRTWWAASITLALTSPTFNTRNIPKFPTYHP